LNKSLDIIIISYNTCEITKNCIRSIIANIDEIKANIIVVDNASTDATVAEILRDFPSVRVIVNDNNLGYSKAVNIGTKYGSSDLMVISNSDVIYRGNSIANLVNCIDESDDIGVVGPAQFYPSGKYQYSFGFLPGYKFAIYNYFMLTSIKMNLRKLRWNLHCVSKHALGVDYVDGAVMMVRRSVFDELNGFDEDYFFYSEEADYCKRVNDKGYRVLHYPKSTVTHLRGASGQGMNSESMVALIASKKLYCKKHLTDNEALFYISSEIFASLINIGITKLLKWLSTGHIKMRLKSKEDLFRLYYKNWKMLKKDY
jgi:GT2 family glycosyltransferase